MRYPIFALILAGALSVGVFEVYYLWSPPDYIDFYIERFSAKIAVLFCISFYFSFVYLRWWWLVLLSLTVAPLFADAILLVLNIVLKKELWFLIVYDWIDDKSFLVAFGVVPGCTMGYMVRRLWDRAKNKRDS